MARYHKQKVVSLQASVSRALAVAPTLRVDRGRVAARGTSGLEDTTCSAFQHDGACAVARMLQKAAHPYIRRCDEGRRFTGWAST